MVKGGSGKGRSEGVESKKEGNGEVKRYNGKREMRGSLKGKSLSTPFVTPPMSAKWPSQEAPDQLTILVY